MKRGITQELSDQVYNSYICHSCYKLHFVTVDSQNQRKNQCMVIGQSELHGIHGLIWIVISIAKLE